MFVGKSLTNIRILNDLSRNQLGEKIGVTEQAIWQYENEYVSPKLEVINKLKLLFDVKSTYFYQEDLLNKFKINNIQPEYIAYRSSTINSHSQSKSESTHIRFLEAFLNKIEKKISYPQDVLLSLREDAILFVNDNEKLEKSTQIKYIAEHAREKLGLESDTNRNLLFLLEKAGAFIFEKSIGDSIDAYSLWSDDNRPYIMLGTIKKSAVRRNFDLAHELGHLLLHYKAEFNMQDKEGYRKLEDEANQFAAAFLLPEKNFITECEEIIKKSNPDAYIDLKKKWLVSLQAIAMRSFNLGLINYQQYRYFYIVINKKGYKTIEPLDNEIPISRPTKVKSILELLFKREIYTVSNLLDDLRVDLKFLSILTGINESFFREHLANENKVFTVNHLEIKSN